MKLPDDFPVKRFLWSLLPWWIVLAYCLLNLWYGAYWEAFIRLIEWSIALAPLTYINVRLFVHWNAYDEQKKKHLLRLTGPWGGTHMTIKEQIPLIFPVVWLVMVFMFFRWLNV